MVKKVLLVRSRCETGYIECIGIYNIQLSGARALAIDVAHAAGVAVVLSVV